MTIVMSFGALYKNCIELTLAFAYFYCVRAKPWHNRIDPKPRLQAAPLLETLSTCTPITMIININI